VGGLALLGFELGLLSQDLTSTMVQPKEPQSKSDINDDVRVAVVLQQYNDTKGHFSLVRWAWALVLPIHSLY
jgi:hypothetical protein